MSSTRRVAPKGPAIEAALKNAALVLCAHGRDGASDIALEYAAKIGRSGEFARVAGCCLKGAPDLAGTLRGLDQRDIYLVPLLMADGYTYRTVLPPLIGCHAPPGARVRLCPSLGRAAGLAGIVTDQAVDLCDDRGWVPETTTLVIAAHGTPRSAASGAAANDLAAAIDRSQRFAAVRTGFLEQAPYFADVLRELRPAPCVVVGFFMDLGGHAGSDIPLTIASAHPDAAYSGALGRSSAIPQLIVELVRAEAAKPA